TGLQAMLANRIKYQRRFFDYDIFISAQELDRLLSWTIKNG
ncbi:DUF2982 domain-containing protein, partial [Vibrio vulnificus]